MTFPHTITLRPVTLSQSEFGGITQDFQGDGTSYAAYFQARTDMLAIINQTGGARSGAVIYVRGECPAKQLDRIDFSGKTYEVMGAVIMRTPSRVHHTKVMVVELDQTTR